MISHVLNLFRIENLSELEARYRLIEVDIPRMSGAADEDHAHEALNSLTKQIAIAERVPVALVRRGGTSFVAVPAAARLTRLEYELTPEVATLKPRNEVSLARFRGGGGEERSVALSFLQFHLRSPVWKCPELWSADPWTYYAKRPINSRENARDVDIYEGFTFRLQEANGSLYLALNLRQSYAESAWLLEGRMPESWHELRMRHVLYHFGNRWYRAQLLDVLDRPIGDIKFSVADGRTWNVFDYTLEEAGEKAPPWVQSLDPGSPGVSYQYPGSRQKRYGAAALCKLLLPTEHPTVARLHHRSVRPPQVRFNRATQLVARYFRSVTLGGRPVRIAEMPLREEGRCFRIPHLRFGQGRVVRVGGEGKNDRLPLERIGKARVGALLDASGGFAVTSPLAKQYVLIPQSLPREIGEDFNSKLVETIREFLHCDYAAEILLYRDQGAETLKTQVDGIVAALDAAGVEGARGLLVLPERAKPDLHNFLKRSLKDRFLFQCVSAGKLRWHYVARIRSNGSASGWMVAGKREHNYVSYLRYTALGVLLVNRQWPFVLEDGTHYDAYIGLDVLENTAAFTFFYKGGRLCHMQACDSKQKEKLTRKQVRFMVYKYLRQDVSHLERPPRSVVLRRDGRSYASEWHGFRDAIEDLKDKHALPRNVLYGVVAVPKSAASRVRLVEDDGSGNLRNPRVGAWRAFSGSEGIVCTTGRPWEVPGTAWPLHVRVANGRLEIEKILEDTFAMSQLCWSAPDRCMRLPVDLKLCDEYLRGIASEADDDEALFGETSEELAQAVSVG